MNTSYLTDSERAALADVSISNGNTKLGRGLILSRTVGDTCCPTCPYLTGVGVPKHARCYAECTENRFRSARAAGERNRSPSVAALRAILRIAAAKRLPLRIHERGDFGNGRRQAIDGRYVLAWERALDAYPDVSVWTYTHIYHSRLSALSRRGVSIYASVHGQEHIQMASRAGFRRFALVLPYRPAQARPQLRSMPVYDGPRYARAHGRRWYVCPAQYAGQRATKLTCDRCGYCIAGAGHVAFLTH